MKYEIDQEFKAANRKHTKQERANLAAMIATEGPHADSIKCAQIEGDPRVYLYDGHSTLEICQEQGVAPPVPRLRLFKSRDEVLECIHQLQRARRNLAPEEMARERQARIDRVVQARAQGLSTRSIAASEGVSQSQVVRDIEDAGEPPGSPELCERCKRIGQPSCPACRAASIGGAEPPRAPRSGGSGGAGGRQKATGKASAGRNSRPKVTGADGKSYPATRPAPQKAAPEPSADRKSQPITDTRCRKLVEAAESLMTEDDVDTIVKRSQALAKAVRDLALDLLNHPSLEEAQAFAAEKKMGCDPEEWFNHFQANGWMVGKVRMRDWRACMMKWERTDKKWSKERIGRNGKAQSYDTTAARYRGD